MRLEEGDAAIVMFNGSLSGCSDISNPSTFDMEWFRQDGRNGKIEMVLVSVKELGGANAAFFNDLLSKQAKAHFVPWLFNFVEDSVAVVPLVPSHVVKQF